MVHALKSDLRTLGLSEVSEKAFVMEKAAGENNEAYILSHHEELMAESDHVVKMIRAAKEG